MQFEEIIERNHKEINRKAGLFVKCFAEEMAKHDIFNFFDVEISKEDVGRCGNSGITIRMFKPSRYHPDAYMNSTLISTFDLEYIADDDMKSYSRYVLERIISEFKFRLTESSVENIP